MAPHGGDEAQNTRGIGGNPLVALHSGAEASTDAGATWTALVALHGGDELGRTIHNFLREAMALCSENKHLMAEALPGSHVHRAARDPALQLNAVSARFAAMPHSAAAARLEQAAPHGTLGYTHAYRSSCSTAARLRFRLPACFVQPEPAYNLLRRLVGLQPVHDMGQQVRMPRQLGQVPTPDEAHVLCGQREVAGHVGKRLVMAALLAWG